jgi:mono/diheme cytochrome c family protein
MRHVWLALVLALALAACHGNVAGDVKGGAQVFQLVCAQCHGATGKPDVATVARIGVKDLTSPELRARITPALVEKQVREGSQNKLMPAFVGALNDVQIRDVASFVASPQFLEPR